MRNRLVKQLQAAGWAELWRDPLNGKLFTRHAAVNIMDSRKNTTIPGTKIIIAESTEIARHGENVSRLLAFIAPYKKWKDEGRHVFVSDRSTIADFGLEDAEMAQLRQKVGFEFSDDDEIYEIAARM